MKNLFLFASAGIACGLLFVNLYNSLVDAKSWGSDLPNSIATTREYFKVVNPGNFFRIFSPLNQVLALLALIVFWKAGPGIRMWLGAALIMYVVADVFTFAYFYPRNDIMFVKAPLTDIATLKAAWQEWSNMNWLRTLIVFIGLTFTCTALHKMYMNAGSTAGVNRNVKM